ncbi:MAG: 3-methyladenine DNA glycosylase [Hyphomicrobiales bacterium]|nr:MAG: 3-methyladenine DNA glycosylase [Hyphomicrobiales bacterium]
MRTFDEIYQIAADRKGGPSSLEAEISAAESTVKLIKLGDDRWLSMMTKSVFQAGFNWKVVAAMWPGFEEVFDGFDIGKCAMLNEDDFDRLVSDKRIIRYGAKIRAVQENAQFCIGLIKADGGVGKALTNWPRTDYIGLLAMLKKDATRLGGKTGQYFLRQMGADGFILSNDVVARLIAEGVVDKQPTSMKTNADVQEAFNNWMDQSGRSLTEISQILARSVG